MSSVPAPTWAPASFSLLDQGPFSSQPPWTHDKHTNLEDLLVPLLPPPAEPEERQPNAVLIILASSRVSEVPATVKS